MDCRGEGGCVPENTITAELKFAKVSHGQELDTLSKYRICHRIKPRRNAIEETHLFLHTVLSPTCVLPPNIVSAEICALGSTRAPPCTCGAGVAFPPTRCAD
jgi:hypothetical protein